MGANPYIHAGAAVVGIIGGAGAEVASLGVARRSARLAAQVGEAMLRAESRSEGRADRLIREEIRLTTRRGNLEAAEAFTAGFREGRRQP